MPEEGGKVVFFGSVYSPIPMINETANLLFNPLRNDHSTTSRGFFVQDHLPIVDYFDRG